MAKYLGSVCKLCRREGEKLFLKGARCFGNKCPVEGKARKPGQHGTPIGAGGGRRSKQSEYALRLREKQKAKRIAGLTEAQFYNYFKKASKMKGLTGLNLIYLLSMRLDNVVYLLGLAPSRRAARELVTHGHYKVNGKKITAPGYNLSPGDKIVPSAKLLSETSGIPAAREDYSVSPPAWLSYDKSAHTGSVVSAPAKEQTPYAGINEQYIVELYSK